MLGYYIMLAFEKRILFFLLGCIPIRIILAAIPVYVDKKYLPYYGGILLLIAASFFVLYFNKMRLNAFEGGGKLGGQILDYYTDYSIYVPQFIRFKKNSLRGCL